MSYNVSKTYYPQHGDYPDVVGFYIRDKEGNVVSGHPNMTYSEVEALADAWAELLRDWPLGDAYPHADWNPRKK